MSGSPDATFRPVNRLLKMAVVGGVEAAVKLHIERGDDVNARDDRGLTPLMLAAAKNRARVCRVLIDAGADVSARDGSGNDALFIAMAAGAADAATEIESAIAALRDHVSHQPSLDEPDRINTASELPRSDRRPGAIENAPSRTDVLALASIAPIKTEPRAAVPGFSDDAQPSAASTVHAKAALCAEPVFATDDDTEPIDLSGWVAEAEPPPPVGDASLAAAPTAIHRAISLHSPIDDSADWLDFEAFLPAHAAPILRPNNAEEAAELRALLLRALREGSVPSAAVDDLDGVSGEAAEIAPTSPLRYVIGDLGAETDERFEYRAPHETFEVHVAPAESADEEQALDEALTFLADLEFTRNVPMRLYMRELQRKSLINADEEVVLAKAMGNAEAQALDALATWPAGIQQVLAQIEKAKAGMRALNSVTTGGREEAEPDHEVIASNAELVENVAVSFADERASATADPDEVPDDSTDEPAGVEPLAASIFETAEQLRALAANADHSSLSSLRAALDSLALKRAFLIEVAESAASDSAPEAARFAEAIQTLATARDKMVGANLRLVLSLAKRFLYSGVPMDDLIQEANIGLIKAVDKFDWRRGHKFSTMATWWIRQQVSRSVADDSRTIRLPVHIHEKLYRAERAAEAMSKEIGHTPSAAALAARLDMPEQKLVALLRSGAAPQSIHEMDAEGDGRFDWIEDENAADPFETVATKELRETLVSMLSRLDHKPGLIMRMRFGLDEVAGEPRTLEEVGLHFDLTRERIRQIEGQVLRRLAHRKNRQALRGWVADEPEKKVVENNGPTPEKGKREEAQVPEVPRSTGAAHIAGPSDNRGERQESTALEKLLARAVEMGLLVEDDKDGATGSIWVNLGEPKNGSERILIRKLLAAGFEFWPGKGYWK